jgi:hypothetical protein
MEVHLFCPYSNPVVEINDTNCLGIDALRKLGAAHYARLFA